MLNWRNKLKLRAMQEATDKKRKKNGESKNGRKRGIEQRYETGKNWKKC